MPTMGNVGLTVRSCPIGCPYPLRQQRNQSNEDANRAIQTNLHATNAAMRRKKRLTWRAVEHKMFIPNRKWSTSLAQEFADLYADSIGKPHKPIVFDLGTRGGYGERALGIHRDDRISLSLVLDSRERWRVLIHELAHYLHGGHRKDFIETMRFIYVWFREWEKVR